MSQQLSTLLQLPRSPLLHLYCQSTPKLAPIANPQPTWRSVVSNWLKQEPKDRGSGGNSGGRPGAMGCLITPTDNARLWTTQPRFVWQGNYSVTGVRLKADSATWEETTPVQNQSGNRLNTVRQALVPGETYEWGFFADQNR